MPIAYHEELRHRGEPLVVYPEADLWKALGGGDGAAALIEDLYRRIEQDELLREAFPHFNSGEGRPSSSSGSAVTVAIRTISPEGS